MKVIIPKQVEDSINSIKQNKSVKKSALKIWTALYLKSYLKNSQGYFPVSSEYLKSINLRYYNILNHFIETGIIDFYKKAYQDEKDIFNTIYRKSYNRDKGICAKYKILVPLNGREIEVDMKSDKNTRWYEVLENSLAEMGLETKIVRDSFGRRVHHSGIKDYKSDFRGFYSIDSICSQPRLLYLYMKEKQVMDEFYYSIFENELDFYTELSYKLKLESRDEAKDLFMHWLNGNGYVPNFGIHILFPEASKFLRKIKQGNYKNSSSTLQRIESKIWIDDILNNIPCDFAIPIHDCLIVKEMDSDNVLKYCMAKYPELRFKKNLIK